MTKIKLTHGHVHQLVQEMAEELTMSFTKTALDEGIKIYPIPRGGIPVAYALSRFMPNVRIVDLPELADAFVDDLIDSGATEERYCDEFPETVFTALLDKRDDITYRDSWVVFPWETADEEAGIEDNIRRIMQYIGEDPDREGLQETPARVAKAMSHWYSGYGKNPKDVMKVFKDGSEGCDEMVVVEDIPFFSNCEHHMAPFFGTATIAYIPNGKILGISKIPRLLDIFARRMQVQERLTNQVAEAMMEELSPLGVGVLINARHLCMESRGIEKSGTSTTTIALRGAFKEQASTRNEFMLIARK